MTHEKIYEETRDKVAAAREKQLAEYVAVAKQLADALEYFDPVTEKAWAVKKTAISAYCHLLQKGMET